MTTPVTQMTTPVTEENLNKRFDYHKPGDQQTVVKHEAVRQVCKELAAHVVDLVPAGREQSFALTHIEEAMMWANAGIARNQ